MSSPNALAGSPAPVFRLFRLLIIVSLIFEGLEQFFRRIVYDIHPFPYRMEQIRHIWNTAPLLRYVNRDSQWHQVQQQPEGASIHTQDGVFANLAALQDASRSASSANAASLPSYQDSLEDPVPPYWETQAADSWDGEVYVDGLPVGSVLSVLWTALVSSMFQFVGFVVTYLLHTSHGSKAGSQIGLCVSLVNLGLASLPVDPQKVSNGDKLQMWVPKVPSAIDFDPETLQNHLNGFQSALQGADPVAQTSTNPHSKKLLSYVLIAAGGLIAVRALWDFFRVKKLEYRMLHPPEPPAAAGAPPSAAAADSEPNAHSDDIV